MIDVADDVMIHVPECPTLLVREYTDKAMRKLGEDIGLETQTRKFRTLAGTRRYPVEALGGRELVGIVAVRIDGAPVPWSVTGDYVRLDACPVGGSQSLEVDVSIAPDGSNKAADYQNAVKDYALYRLLLIPQQRWTDLNLSAVYLQSYGVQKTKLAADKFALEMRQRNENMTMRAKYKWV